jgi:hypothetical protein
LTYTQTVREIKLYPDLLYYTPVKEKKTCRNTNAGNTPNVNKETETMLT